MLPLTEQPAIAVTANPSATVTLAKRKIWYM